MSETTTPKIQKEALDRRLIRLIGYIPTCLLVGVVTGVATIIFMYAYSYFRISADILDRLDDEYDRLLAHLSIVIPPGIFGSAVAGTIIGLITIKITKFWQKLSASLLIGIAAYLFATVIWRVVTKGNISDALDYLRFFALQLSMVGLLIGLSISFLPQPEKNKS